MTPDALATVRVNTCWFEEQSNVIGTLDLPWPGTVGGRPDWSGSAEASPPATSIATHAVVALPELQVIGIETVAVLDEQSTRPPAIDADPNEPIVGLAAGAAVVVGVVSGVEALVVAAPDDLPADVAAVDGFEEVEAGTAGAMLAVPDVPLVAA